MSAAPCDLRDDAARAVLRGLRVAGSRIIRRARSPHGSDCSSDCHDGTNKAIGQCRCLRVMRVRVPNAQYGGGTTDWLLIFGDQNEGRTVRLHGPFTTETPLFYGGGFWCRVEV